MNIIHNMIHFEGCTIFLFFLCGLAHADDWPCAARAGDNDQGYVCVCNSTYCDTVQTPERLDHGLYYFYKTSNSTPGFTKTTGGFIRDMAINTNDLVFTINVTTKYQEIVGFGGAITDSALLNINYLPEGAKTKLIESYFGPDGIEYSILRVPIGSTDFSSKVYTLDDVPYDLDLEHFSLSEEDYNLRIPLIKKAMNISQRTINLLACSWSSPSWMKNNNSARSQYISHKYLGTWARYHVRFLEEYQKEGLPVWALSGGNEVVMLIGIDSMQSMLNFTLQSAPIQRGYLKYSLKPLLRHYNFSDVKFLTLDDERIFAPYWMTRFSNDPDALNEVDGIALHTYFDEITSTTLLDDLHENYPNMSIYYTETCINTGWGSGAVLLGSWDRAETYLSSIFQNLNHWSRSYLDWNLALDTSGGPSFSYNVDAPVIINNTAAEFYKQPMFYAMGHFSKFVHPGSKRVQILSSDSQITTNHGDKIAEHQKKEALQEFLLALKTSPLSALKRRSISVTKEVQCIGFTNPDGSITAIVLNTQDKSVKVKLVDSRVGSVSLEIEDHSVNSFIYWP